MTTQNLKNRVITVGENTYFVREIISADEVKVSHFKNNKVSRGKPKIVTLTPGDFKVTKILVGEKTGRTDKFKQVEADAKKASTEAKKASTEAKKAATEVKKAVKEIKKVINGATSQETAATKPKDGRAKTDEDYWGPRSEDYDGELDEYFEQLQGIDPDLDLETTVGS